MQFDSLSTTRSVIDVGCAELIINGQVKVEYGSEVDHLEPSKVILKNGTKLDADSIILACAPFVYPISYIWLTDPWESRTGWKGVRTKLRDTFGDDVIDRTDEVWGTDENGEIRAGYKPSGQPGVRIMQGRRLFVGC